MTFLYELYQKCDVTHCFRKSAREHLAQYVEIEVDLPNQTVSSPDKVFILISMKHGKINL